MSKFTKDSISGKQSTHKLGYNKIEPDILKDGRFGYLAPLANMKKFSETIIHAYANQLPADLLRKRSKKYSISSQGSQYAEVINRM